MKSQIRISNRADRCQIDIEGVIGVPEEWQFDHPDERVATYEKFRDTLRRIAAVEASEVVVNIRSTGGDVGDALLIHDALVRLKGHLTTRCYGYTASAATIIAQAASEGCRQISPNALYLIHASACATEGNADELSAKVELLRSTDARIAAIYAERSGRPVEEFAALMAENNGNGRWLSPEETMAAGLADAPIPATEPSEGVTRNFVRGWEKLLHRLGVHPATEPLPRDRNTLKADADADHIARRQEADAEERRRKAGPTEVMAAEDPSTGEAAHSPNDKAYAEDAKLFHRQ